MSSSELDQAFSHKIQRHELQPGDHIYSWRRLCLYSHHGIYVGNGKVIHFTGSPSDSIAGMGSITSSSSASRPCQRCGPKIRASGVVSSCLECFLKKGKLYRYQYGVSAAELAIKIRGMCTTAPSDPAEDVISRAEILLQNNGFGGYNLRENNCEDFALYGKTGYNTDAELSGIFYCFMMKSKKYDAFRVNFEQFPSIGIPHSHLQNAKHVSSSVLSIE